MLSEVEFGTKKIGVMKVELALWGWWKCLAVENESNSGCEVVGVEENQEK